MEKFHLDFLFTKSIGPSLALTTKVLRSEELYAKDLNAEQTALSFLQQLRAAHAEDHMLLIHVDSQIGVHSAVRSHKGLLYGCKGLPQLPHRHFEVDCGDGRTRLAVVVDMSSATTLSCPQIILNYLFSCIVITPHSLDDLCEAAFHWVDRSSKSVLGIDYVAVSRSLERDDQIAVARYFPPDNERPELFVVVARRGILQQALDRALTSVMFTGAVNGREIVRGDT